MQKEKKSTLSYSVDITDLAQDMFSPKISY